MEGTVRCSANYVPLSPLSFLERAAVVYADKTSVVYGSTSYTWRQTHDRCLRLASGLAQLGISRGDVVATLSANVPALYELHFGVPMTGGVLSVLNTQYDSSLVSVLLSNSDAKAIFVEHQLLKIAEDALSLLSESNSRPPLLIVIDEPQGIPSSHKLDYETLLRTANPDFDVNWPIDECDPISLSYTSGTTSIPKGVVYSHRGAYLNAIAATILFNDITTMPVYLWAVPMFHCNGWCLAWGVAAQGGINVCIRNVTAKVIFDSIASHGVTHMGGAPTILNMIVNCPLADRKPLPGDRKVGVLTGGAAPPPQVLAKIEELGFHITPAYGLTEAYGPAAVCTWKPEWDELPLDQRAKMKAMHGVQHIGMAVIDVKDPITMTSVPADGKTMGEIVLRGNTVMSGYFKDLKRTEEAFAGGWFRTGDLGVKHADGYIHMKDRSQDIIISDGENISTIEVESVVFSHPAVLEAAVVGRPDEHWGETPCVFVHLKEGASADAEEIISFCRDRLPHYKVPMSIVFGELPKTSTGKTQKYILREKAKTTESLSMEEMIEL